MAVEVTLIVKSTILSDIDECFASLDQLFCLSESGLNLIGMGWKTILIMELTYQVERTQFCQLCQGFQRNIDIRLIV